VTGRRSNRLLVFAVVGAVFAGAAATLLKPADTTEPEPIAVDAAKIQRGLLDQLVRDAKVRDPAKLPALTMFVAVFTHGGDWVVDRLTNPDVPARLTVAFTERLPRGQAGSDAAADRLLGPILRGSSSFDLPAAIEVLRGRGRLELATSARCACRFGFHPANPEPGTAVTLVAFGRAPIAWSPTTVEGEVLLNLRSDSAGSSALATVMDPQTTFTVRDGPAPGVALELVRTSR
jgi:hypothetical protein